MSHIPPELLFAKTHEWFHLEPDGSATVGISDYAQASLGDITYVQLPKVGHRFNAGECLAVVESVKAASDVNSPVRGVVVAVNETLLTKPETVNAAPYAEGWFVRLGELGPHGALYDAAAYKTFVGE